MDFGFGEAALCLCAGVFMAETGLTLTASGVLGVFSAARVGAVRLVSDTLTTVVLGGSFGALQAIINNKENKGDGIVMVDRIAGESTR